MPTSKNTKDSYAEKERGKVASGMQYQDLLPIAMAEV